MSTFFVALRVLVGLVAFAAFVIGLAWISRDSVRPADRLDRERDEGSRARGAALLNVIRRLTPLGMVLSGVALAAFIALVVGTVFVWLGKSLR